MATLYLLKESAVAETSTPVTVITGLRMVHHSKMSRVDLRL